MASLIPGFEYDIFISYRHNDNLDGWVTEFVQNLERELRATIKQPLNIYFDKNPFDGLLETHDVDKSLEGKLKCVIFIPVLSQTYCDPKSFAWLHEFCVFNKMAQRDALGRDIKLTNGNFASRILPIKIHELDVDDKTAIESETGGVLRAVEFIYREAGVNRPLRSKEENPERNQNQTIYRNQVNRVANAIKEIISALTAKPGRQSVADSAQSTHKAPISKLLISFIGLGIILIAAVVFYLFSRPATSSDEIDVILDRAERYIEEGERFNDKRYFVNAHQAIEKAFAIDSLNERALYLSLFLEENAKSAQASLKKLERINPKSKYTILSKAGEYGRNHKWQKGIGLLKELIEKEPENKDALKMLCSFHYNSGDYKSALEYESKVREATGEGMPDVLSNLYVELGDFKEAERHFRLKQHNREFECADVEGLQRILLCSGDFERLENFTDSICAETECDECALWILRAKAHTGHYREALPFVRESITKGFKINRRTPAFILWKTGNLDSANLLLKEELEFDHTRLKDTAYHQGFPLYSLAAINALQGNHTESIKWLRKYADKGFEAGSEWYIIHDPLFDDARKDPKYFADFIQIVQKAQQRKNAIREKIRDVEADVPKQ